MAYSYRVAGNYKKSREAVERILLFPNTDIYRKYQAAALYEIGRIQTAKGENEQAILSFQDALRQFSEPSSEQAHIRLALGNLYQSIDEYELAQKFFDAALNDIRQFPDVYDESQAEHLIGLYNFNGNEFETAIGHFKAAAVLREKVGNRRGQAISLTFLGMTYQSLKMFDEAIEIFQKVLPVSRELEDRINQLDTLIFIAYSLRGKGDSSKALELYEQALSLFDNKNSVSLNALYLNRGVTNRKLFKFAEARGDFEKTELLYRQIGDMKGEAVTLYHFAILDGEENRLDEAKAKIERALQIHEYEQAKYKNIRRLSDFLETRRRFFDSYIDILMKLDKARPGENYAFRALQTSENARMRTLIWEYREAVKNTPQTVDFQLISQMQNIQQQIGEQLSLLAKAQSHANQAIDIPDIERTIAVLNKQNETFKAQLRHSNPNIANLASPPTLSLEQMQAELDDETVLVEYSLGEQRSYLWIVGKNNFQSFALPKRAEIEIQAKNYYETLRVCLNFQQASCFNIIRIIASWMKAFETSVFSS